MGKFYFDTYLQFSFNFPSGNLTKIITRHFVGNSTSVPFYRIQNIFRDAVLILRKQVSYLVKHLVTIKIKDKNKMSETGVPMEPPRTPAYQLHAITITRKNSHPFGWNPFYTPDIPDVCTICYYLVSTALSPFSYYICDSLAPPPCRRYWYGITWSCRTRWNWVCRKRKHTDCIHLGYEIFTDLGMKH